MTSSSSDEEYYNIIVRVHRERHIRPRVDHFSIWDDMEFYKRFRMSKQSAHMVLEQIRHKIQNPTNW